MYKFNNRFRKDKYGARKCTIDNITFDSTKEAHRYLYLKSELEDGNIKDLELQPKFLLQDKFIYEGKTIRAIHYISDFKYIDVETGKTIVEDTKGMRTDIYLLKKKIFLKLYGDKLKFIEI